MSSMLNRFYLSIFFLSFISVPIFGFQIYESISKTRAARFDFDKELLKLEVVTPKPIKGKVYSDNDFYLICTHRRRDGRFPPVHRGHGLVVVTGV